MKATPRLFNQSKCNTRNANVVPLRRFPRVLGHEPRSKLLAAVAERTVATSHSFRAPDVVNMLWAYARWHRGGSSGSSEVVAALSSNALSSLTAFTPYQCANLAWSLAMLDAPLPVGSRDRTYPYQIIFERNYLRVPPIARVLSGWLERARAPRPTISTSLFPRLSSCFFFFNTSCVLPRFHPCTLLALYSNVELLVRTITHYPSCSQKSIHVSLISSPTPSSPQTPPSPPPLKKPKDQGKATATHAAKPTLNPDHPNPNPASTADRLAKPSTLPSIAGCAENRPLPRGSRARHDPGPRRVRGAAAGQHGADAHAVGGGGQGHADGRQLGELSDAVGGERAARGGEEGQPHGRGRGPLGLRSLTGVRHIQNMLQLRV